MNKGKGKNGKIEFLRCIFSSYVVLFHISRNTLPKYKTGITAKLTMGAHGCMGVEFFFILSGFLMGATLFRKISQSQSDPVSEQESQGQHQTDDWCGFLKRKYLAIFSQHVIAFIILYIIYCCGNRFGLKNWIVTLVNNIPPFFLLQKTGLYTGAIINSVEWYISSMLLAMAIWYPFARKWYYQVSRYIAPLSAVLILGYVQYTAGHISGSPNWEGLTFRCNLRALAEIAIGLFLYEFTRRYMESDSFRKGAHRVKLTVLEVISFVWFTGYAFSALPRTYEVWVIPAVMIMISVAFSNATFGYNLFNKPVFFFLGKLSLPIYLGQLGAIYIKRYYLSGDRFSLNEQCFIEFIIVFIIAFLIMGIDDMWKKLKNVSADKQKIRAS